MVCCSKLISISKTVDVSKNELDVKYEAFMNIRGFLLRLIVKYERYIYCEL